MLPMGETAKFRRGVERQREPPIEISGAEIVDRVPDGIGRQRLDERAQPFGLGVIAGIEPLAPIAQTVLFGLRGIQGMLVLAQRRARRGTARDFGQACIGNLEIPERIGIGLGQPRDLLALTDRPSDRPACFAAGQGR